MLRKVNGFTKFMNKLDGKETPDANYTRKDWLRSKLSEGSCLLLEFLRSECDRCTYLGFASSRRVSAAERQAIMYTRHRAIGNDFCISEVGLHISDWDTYRQAVEYLLSNPACQRQDDHESTAPEGESFYSTMYNPSEANRALFHTFERNAIGDTSTSSRAREELIRSVYVRRALADFGNTW